MEQINQTGEATQVHNEEHNHGGKRLKKGGKTPLIVFCVLLVLLVGAYAGLCAYVSSRTTFAPNRRLNGVDVGGLTVEQAQTKLEETLLAQPVEIRDAEQNMSYTVTLADLGYSQESFAGDAQFWMDSDRSLPFLVQGWNYLCYWMGRYPGGASWPEMDAEVLRDATQEAAEFFYREPVHGRYELLEDTVVITRAREGRQVNETALMTALADVAAYSKNNYLVEISSETLPAKEITAQEVYDALSGEMKNAAYDKATGTITEEQTGIAFTPAAAGVQKALDQTEPGKAVQVKVEIQHPTVTAEELKEVMFRDVLGETRTHVSGTAARINNVKLSAAAINGYVMNSGEVFSYNEAVGQRTAANGYQAAPAYIRGETVDEIGGGICQTSSTLYLACLLGDLEITERYAHRYVPAYIPWGMDATVSWGGPDYKFTNNTDYPIKIVTEYSKNYLTVKILGTNVNGKYAKMTNEVLSTTPWETVYEEDPTLAPGTPDTEKTTPYTGYKVKTYHTIYDKDGNVIDSHYEATSDYKVRNKVIVRAPASATPVAPATPTLNPEWSYEELPETPVETETPVEPTDPVQSGASAPSENPVEEETTLPDDVFWSEEGIL